MIHCEHIEFCRFGGVILESNYSDVPFGTPATIIRLGTTLRPGMERGVHIGSCCPSERNGIVHASMFLLLTSMD